MLFLVSIGGEGGYKGLSCLATYTGLVEIVLPDPPTNQQICFKHIEDFVGDLSTNSHDLAQQGRLIDVGKVATCRVSGESTRDDRCSNKKDCKWL